jgi:hypothetical protein
MVMMMKRKMVYHFTIIFITQMKKFAIQRDLKSISFKIKSMLMLIL